MRKGRGGDWFWWPSMGQFGGVGTQVIFLVLMEWVSENLFVWDGRVLRVILDLIWARALRYVFGMMFGVGIDLLKLSFLGCLVLLVLRKRPLRIMWSELMVLSNGIFSLRG
jgi:hypothetical protein